MSPTDRKAQILDHAESLLCQVGFASFSYQDLATRLNIAKPSIHHHFPSKEALGLALLERYHGMLTGMREQIAAKSSSAAEQFSSFLKMADDKHEDCEICPLGALQSDFESLPDSIRVETVRLTERMHAWITDLLLRGREAGEMRYAGKPEAQAWLIMSALQGARQNARVLGAQAYQTVAQQVLDSLFETV